MSPCVIHDLSDSLLLNILSHLYLEDLVINARNFCIKWRNIVDSHVFCKKIVYDPEDEQLEKMANCLRNMPSLTKFHNIKAKL